MGKTKIARAFASQVGAAYLRVDTIERELDGLFPGARSGPGGYVMSYALARDNLLLKLAVVADCVNPLGITRETWRTVAQEANTTIVEAEVICSNTVEHRRRVEARKAASVEEVLPSWADVVKYEYEEWDRPHLVLDTATTSLEQCVQGILKHVKQLNRTVS